MERNSRRKWKPPNNSNHHPYALAIWKGGEGKENIMDYEKIAKRFVSKLSIRLHVTINPYTERQLVGEIVSLMKSSAQQSTQLKTADVEEVWDQSADRDWGYGGA